VSEGPHRAGAWGPVGSLVTALCCLGAAPILAALAAVGLGFLVNDLILIPLRVFFLGATLWALHRDRPRHEAWEPFAVASVGSVLTVGGLWVSGAVVGVGLAFLFAGSVWNWVSVRPHDLRSHRGGRGDGRCRSGRRWSTGANSCGWALGRLRRLP